MKILTIHGSPHKGSTYDATMEFLKLLGNRIEIEVTHEFLFQEHLELCRGCGACVIRGEERCPNKDRIREIHALILESDAVLITTPVYALQVTALVKNFIERSSFVFHRPCYFGKWFMSISTQFYSGDKDVEKYLASVMNFWGFNVIPGLRLTMSQKKEVIEKTITAAVNRFLNVQTHKRFLVPKMKDLMMFRVRRTVMKSKSYLEEFPRDVEYFRKQGWLQSPYYYDVHLKPLKRVIGRFFDALGRKMIKKDDRLDETPEMNQPLIGVKNEGINA